MILHSYISLPERKRTRWFCASIIEVVMFDILMHLKFGTSFIACLAKFGLTKLGTMVNYDSLSEWDNLIYNWGAHVVCNCGDVTGPWGQISIHEAFVLRISSKGYPGHPEIAVWVAEKLV